jgi:beta-lactam-binding protein with PASTA domain
VTEVDKNQGPPGTVVDQNPQAGAAVARGSEVGLSVEKEQISMPNLVSKTLNDAMKEIQAAGLTVGPIQYKVVRNTGRVTSQKPDPGTKVSRNMPVSLWVDWMFFPHLMLEPKIMELAPAVREAMLKQPVKAAPAPGGGR